jgi:hypothetical protein
VAFSGAGSKFYFSTIQIEERCEADKKQAAAINLVRQGIKPIGR